MTEPAPEQAEKSTATVQALLRQLLDIFSRLLIIDEGIKTGGMPGQTAYELLIADLTR